VILSSSPPDDHVRRMLHAQQSPRRLHWVRGTALSHHDLERWVIGGEGHRLGKKKEVSDRRSEQRLGKNGAVKGGGEASGRGAGD
jgi:hypothetical protein